MSWTRGILIPLVGSAVVMLPAISVAQAREPRERVLYALVVDERGAPVSGLGVGDFVVKEDGVSREVLRVTPATAPMDGALVVDNSQAAERDIPFLRNAVRAFAEAMTPEHQVALVAIAERPTVLTDYSSNQAQLEKAVGRLFAQPGSGAYLQDALIEVSRGLERRQSERAAIVAVHTEGVEFSTAHYETVVDAVKKAGARLIVLTLTVPGGELDTEEARSRSVAIARGTRATGGFRDVLLTNQSLPEKLKQVAAQLLAEYRVVYARPETLIPPERAEVETRKPELKAYGTPARTQK